MKYLKGDLLKVCPTQGILLHSCNCHGIWGGGIARQLAVKYPKTYKLHEEHCSKFENDPSQLLGTSQLLPIVEEQNKGNDKYMICLFTSISGGSVYSDSPEKILKNTDTALNHLLFNLTNGNNNYIDHLKVDGKFDIYLPTINSGIFRTPWEETCEILRNYEKYFNFNVVLFE